jgi:hypothetical protein
MIGHFKSPEFKINSGKFFILLLVLSIIYGCREEGKKEVSQESQSKKRDSLIAKTYNSGFSLAHDTYNGLSSASDGNIYYVLCSQSIDTGAQVYVFHPDTEIVEHLGDLTEICGEKGQKSIVQGKSHVNFVESKGKLFFATHVGYYSIIDGMEKMGIPPEGYKPYPGGHLLSYDMKSKEFEDLVIPLKNEGILTMNMDIARGLIYCLTWPTGYFFRYNINNRELTDFGPATGKGEDGKGKDFRVICRSLAINPNDGNVFMTTSEGNILTCGPEDTSLSIVEGDNMRKDYFGLYDPSSAGNMGYNWRQVIFYPGDNKIYGVHGNSGYLFRFDPSNSRIEVLDRITSLPSKRSGMFDQFSYGYLGFTLGPDGHTLYYLTGGPIYIDGERVMGKSSTAMGEAKGLENLHLITYDIPTETYKDHGPVFYENGDRPLYVNSIAVGKDGSVYTLARITENGKTRTDLIRIPNPFNK